MEVGFRQKRMADTFNSEQAMVRKFGPEPAKRIMVRLIQLAAAACLEDLRNLPGRCHELTGNRDGQFSLDLHGPYRLIFEPADDVAVPTDGAELNWTTITAVTIIEITDTHDN